jgi:hypothetical protein
MALIDEKSLKTLNTSLLLVCSLNVRKNSLQGKRTDCLMVPFSLWKDMMKYLRC